MTIIQEVNLYPIIGLLIGLLTSVVILCIAVINRYRRTLSEYYDLKCKYLQKSNRVSMIEYYYREFKEGKNAFTVLRDIGDVLGAVEGDNNGKQ